MFDRIAPLHVTRWSAIGCVLYFFVACKPEATLDASRERSKRADSKLTIIRLESQKTVAMGKEKLLALQESKESSIVVADEAEAALEDAKFELQTLKEEFATYRNTYRTKLRTDILETVFPDVIISGGRQLTDFRVKSIKDAEMAYMSNETMGRIPLAEIPPVVGDFLRVTEETEDREIFPELVPRRESDISAEEKLARKKADGTMGKEQREAELQKIRNTKARLKNIYANRERELKAMLDSLDDSRVKLSTKRRRHQEYNEFHRTNVRDKAIANLSKSITKIDKRSRLTYKKINLLRDLMRKNR